ncbi:hypothetical protein EVG20_g5445 [Dentipellis fragilis]|uniref:Threonine/serine exporter-like N-terminal domain-containing protein n=1 Tax=Dentipellis fragilis TaxID=205917 RepID=A0A4Y9YSV1_9AGAM|nr:hypothetical protein EVG20_g5445 [Dentipellis fragilis]
MVVDAKCQDAMSEERALATLDSRPQPMRFPSGLEQGFGHFSVLAARAPKCSEATVCGLGVDIDVHGLLLEGGAMPTFAHSLNASRMAGNETTASYIGLRFADWKEGIANIARNNCNLSWLADRGFSGARAASLKCNACRFAYKPPLATFLTSPHLSLSHPPSSALELASRVYQSTSSSPERKQVFHYHHPTSQVSPPLPQLRWLPPLAPPSPAGAPGSTSRTTSPLRRPPTSLPYTPSDAGDIAVPPTAAPNPFRDTDQASQWSWQAEGGRPPRVGRERRHPLREGRREARQVLALVLPAPLRHRTPVQRLRPRSSLGQAPCSERRRGEGSGLLRPGQRQEPPVQRRHQRRLRRLPQPACPPRPHLQSTRAARLEARGPDWEHDTDFSMSRGPSMMSQRSTGGWGMNRMDSNLSVGSEPLDPDDPKITGATRMLLDDPEDLEQNCKQQMDLRYMNYKQRRKEAQRIKIQFNVTSVLNRQKFIIKLAKTLMTFGAPSHRIESQLVAASRILEIDAEFIHLPNIVLVSFGDPEMKTSETHYIKCGGRLALGNLHKVHTIYRQVVHDEISAKKATTLLNELLNAPPIYKKLPRCMLGFMLSALICPLAFGGSFLDMWIAGFGAFVLCGLQLTLVTKSALYANVFEITIAIFISFLARGLSSIRSEVFCYTAISSAGIVGILPGYLILSSSLELASKNILTGSVKMVYALIYTLFLGFGLQIGSDLYLLFDPTSRHKLDALAASITHTVVYTGAFVADNSTRFTAEMPLFGTFSFSNGTTLTQEHIVNGCYRPPSFPWYLQPFPWWAQFFIVPLFSVCSSLANLQPWKSKQLPVMVIISCIAYAANKIANHYIFNRSDVVSAIGAFAVGVLGNVYSRKMGGTAFTSMVTGVLFLVPSGLSQAGGITASGNGVDIGGAMIAVTIGITVGLFMSQALVYTFGTRKNAAMFSF